jgi:hypothetical protein
MLHKTITALLVVAVAGFVTIGASASSAATKKLPQSFTLYSANVDNKDAPELLEAIGPIHGIGIAKPDDDVRGKAIPITVTFTGGKLLLTARGNFQWKPDLTACTATVVNRGTYTITGGTGAYHGANGSGTYVERGAGIGARGPNGACLEKFKLNYVIATLRGTASLGS